jgi:hypothetical protein
VNIEGIHFLPPLAIARLGPGASPLDCFNWQTDKSLRGGNRTVIRPALTFEVMGDGSLRAFLPKAISFKRDGLLRPVAPFFELWANFDGGQAAPLTLELLDRLGASLENIEYTITVANRKAQRRTLSAACAYIASVSSLGNDHGRKPLLAFSPHNADEEPLVTRERPIPLGHFQVIRPIEKQQMGADLSVLRVRFTPAKGQVYGPPTAVGGPASPLPPGLALDPSTLGGRMHEIVPPENRILNASTKWSRYVMDAEGEEDPEPSDSYDGANVGNNCSWGVVDDTCDGIIEAQLVIRGKRLVATARVLSSCPDFAPDRRPFYSLADDLADRDLSPVVVGGDIQTLAEIADLFARAFETASLMNLDANRYRAIKENGDNTRTRPQTNSDTMTLKDSPPAAFTAEFFPSARSSDGDNLPYSDIAHFRHGQLYDARVLVDFLLQTPKKRLKELIRPPFARFDQLRNRPQSGPDFRDARRTREELHDMRMPPYLRDSDFLPLSLTHRQYDALMKFLDLLQPQDEPEEQ